MAEVAVVAEGQRSTSPGVASSFRSAAFDFYYQSIRLVPANILWGGSVLAWLWFGLATGPLVALASAPLIAVPYVAIARLAALTVRGHDVVLSDVVDAIRRYGLPGLIAGAIATLACAILASNVIIGANLGGPAGWLLSTFAAMGLVALWVYGIAFWILLVDPDREDRRAMTRARAALLLAVAIPGRLSWLALLLFLLLSVSTVAVVALLTIAPAYALLVSGRYVLPRADRLERWYEDRRAAGP